jgi:lipopolysaccharide transport system permease protein
MRLLRGNLQAFREFSELLTRHRDLTWEMARREILDRYSGQVFGPLWAIGHPLFMMGLYVFIFVVVFRQKIGGTADMPLDYTTYILSGMIPWIAFQETLAKSCTAITGHANVVKQMMFPLEVLPTKGALASLIPQAISTIILIAYVLVSHGGLLWTYVLLPLLLVLQLLAMLGAALLLAAIGAFFRDTKDFMQWFCAAGIYLMPVFYLPNWVPAMFQPLLYANPFSYLIWCYQDVLYFGRFEHPWAWPVLAGIAIGWYVMGYRLFRRLKPHFGDVV